MKNRFIPGVDRYVLFLIFLLIIASFLRIYNAPFRYSLGEETVRDAVIGIQGARELQFPLTGAFSSLGPFTFGPWYAYQMILFTIVFPYNYSPWIYLTLISIIYVYIMYKIGKEVGEKLFGAIIATLATFSPAQIISATHLTSHNMTNVFAAGALLIFLKLIKKQLSYWWSFSLGFLIGVGMNLHFQMSGLLIFPLILLIYRRKKVFYFITALLGVVSTFIPLFFFEANNHWFNTKNILYYVLYGKNNTYIPNRWLFYVRDFWPSFWSDALGIPTVLGGAIIVLFLCVIILLIFKRKLPLLIVLLLIGFLFNFILLRYYWGPRFFGYLNFLRPFVFIFTAFTIIQIAQFKKGIYGVVIILLTLIVVAFSRIQEQLIHDGFTRRISNQIQTLETHYPNKKFNIFSCSSVYRGRYNAEVFSFVFLLDLKKRLDSRGIPIAVKSEDCEYPFSEDTISSIANTHLVSFMNVSKEKIVEKKWNSVTFSSIYEANARWWFKEQP